MNTTNEKKAEKLTKDQFINKINEVSKLLKLTANYGDNENFNYSNHATLTNEKGVSISVNNGGYKNQNRFSLSVSYPRNCKDERFYTKIYPSITLSESKTAEQIAKDIEKRLLPEYLVELEKCIEGNQRDAFFLNVREETAQKVCKLFNKEYKKGTDQKSFYLCGDVQRAYNLEIDHYGKITFKLDGLSIEETEKIFSLLKTFEPKKEV